MGTSLGSFAANAWAGSFLRHLAAELKSVHLDSRAIVRDIRISAAALYWECEHTLPDKPTKSLIASCCLVLASYRKLKNQRAPGEAFEIVRAAVYRTYRQPMRFMARIWLWLTRDPLKRLGGQWWKKQSERMYGKGMQFEQEETPHSVELLVKRCAFHEFFVEHGQPELTQVFCAWDRNWMDIVDESGRLIRTERPTTISTGGDCCRFRVIRAGKSDGKEHSDIVLLQTSRTQPGAATRGHEVVT